MQQTSGSQDILDIYDISQTTQFKGTTCMLTHTMHTYECVSSSSTKITNRERLIPLLTTTSVWMNADRVEHFAPTFLHMCAENLMRDMGLQRCSSSYPSKTEIFLEYSLKNHTFKN
ncbi:Methyltransferase [Frankliniella fusca]|uniref:Methyltransferase n=1 Tax=Frankliniella fusca TaxID=407009 RepID=A0AAE1I0M1_9NEOP|nr:Methyltransferase [Frankliniella fusca]